MDINVDMNLHMYMEHAYEVVCPLCECDSRPFEHVGQKDPLLTHNQEVMHGSKPANQQCFCQIKIVHKLK